MDTIKNMQIHGKNYEFKAKYDSDGNQINTTYSKKSELNSHILDNNNPHNVTKAQVGLENVDNTSDLDKPISTLVQKALNNKADKVTTEERLQELEDKVFPLSITVTGGGTFEKGVPKTITVSWTVKKGDSVVDAESVTINDSPVEGTSKQFTNVLETTTYTVKAIYQSKQVSGSTKATFIAPMYFGFAANSTSEDLNIISLTKQAIKTSPNGSYSLNNPTSGFYLWLCVPSSMTINKVTSSGFDVPMETNTSGTTEIDTYKCYRSSSQINQGTVNIVVS